MKTDGGARDDCLIPKIIGVKKPGIFIAIILITLFCLNSCGPKSTQSAASINQILATPGQVDVIIDFNDPESIRGWDIKAADENGMAMLKESSYHLLVENSAVAGIYRSVNFSDTTVNFDFQFLSDTPATFGMGCRNSDGGFTFSISTDGNWLINDPKRKLAYGTTDNLNKGVNHIEFSCIKDILSLTLNGTLLGTAQNEFYPQGQIAFSLNSTGKAEVAIDNVSIKGTSMGAPTPDSKAEGNKAESLSETPILMTPTPAISFTPTLTPEGLFYYNDFQNALTGLESWQLYEVPTLKHDNTQFGNLIFPVARGPQIIDALTTEMVYFIYDFPQFVDDIKIEEEFEFLGDGSTSHGLICRYSPTGWYETSINKDGSWQINLVQATDTSVSPTVLASGDSLQIDQGSNKESLSCIGSTISFTFNGKQVASVDNSVQKGGDLFGMTYQEDAPSTAQVQISRIRIVDKNNQELMLLDTGLDSFPFSFERWAIGIGQPQNVVSHKTGFTAISNNDGKAQVTISLPSWVFLINPQEMSRDVEVSMDVVANIHMRNGIGVICGWDDENGGYLFWIKGGTALISPLDFDEHGLPFHQVLDKEFATEKFKQLLLQGSSHHLVAKCGVGLVQFYVDGQLVLSREASEFKYPDKNKRGNKVGIGIYLEESYVADFQFDNYSVSWGLPEATPTP